MNKDWLFISKLHHLIYGNNEICKEKYLFSLFNFWDYYEKYDHYPISKLSKPYSKNIDIMINKEYLVYRNKYNRYLVFIEKKKDYCFEDYMKDTKYYILPIKVNKHLNEGEDIVMNENKKEEVNSIEEEFIYKLKKISELNNELLYKNMMKLGQVDGVYISKGFLFEEDML